MKKNTFTRLATRLFLLPVIISATFVQSAAFAVPDITFYSTNDITHYDPTSCAPNTAGGDNNSGTGGDGNVREVLKYLTGKGLTLAQAAGFAGNMKQESGFDPAIIQGGRRAPSNGGKTLNNYDPVDGVGFGLVQWTFNSRQQPLEKLAKDTGRDIIDMKVQLDYVWQELTGPYKKTLQLIAQTNDPVQAAIIAHDNYEVSADSDEFVKRVRGGAATGYYNQFKGQIEDGKGVNLGDGAPLPVAAGGGACGGTASDFSADGFVVYDQCDPRWKAVPYGTSGKTSCTSGCGPNAMAAAITALTGKAVTPKETVAYASSKGMYVDGVGSSHSLPVVIGNHWNIDAKAISANVSAVNKALDEGSLVILAGTGADPFTGGGHYILIRGKTANGKWKIADSNFMGNGEENSKKEWDPGFIMDITSRTSASSVYALSK